MQSGTPAATPPLPRFVPSDATRRKGSAVLSRTAEYAIRALSYLGTRNGRPFVPAREIANELEVPRPLLGKVLQILTTAGLLQSQRGDGGSFRLVRAPKSITLIEIVEPFDHLGHRMRCVLGQKLCSKDRLCPIHGAWKQSQNTFIEALRLTTLADVERSAHPDASIAKPRLVRRGSSPRKGPTSPCSSPSDPPVTRP